MKKLILPLLLLFTGFNHARSQIYEIVNQIPSLLSPALSGSGSYKGSLEAGWSKTLGNKNADFLEISTSQGYQYNSWFYMGAGMGADILFAHQNDDWGESWTPDYPSFAAHSSTKTAVMLPIFTDFKATFGAPDKVGFYIDLRIGCSFLLSDKYIEIGDGYLTNREYFYLRPSLGFRIPTSTNHPKQAIDVGVSYKLLTSNYWNSYSRSTTLNSLGVTVAYEW
ncbi:MAG: hypothetical protein HDS62_05190 [Bacteroidales bacterium]|nr:hypothetical protein [Bacteroidales bacterium]